MAKTRVLVEFGMAISIGFRSGEYGGGNRNHAARSRGTSALAPACREEGGVRSHQHALERVGLN